MSDDKKPLEFWVIEQSPYVMLIASEPFLSHPKGEGIHVIEYSAYEELERRIAGLVDDVRELEKIVEGEL